MANRNFRGRILITSGPTREYLDPVRYLTNASSGRMGAALAESAIRSGFEVIIVSGPVFIDYPAGVTRIDVTTTGEMLARAAEVFPDSDGVIGVAAPCDYRPVRISSQKLSKENFATQEGTQLSDGRKSPLFSLLLEETPDILAELGKRKKEGQWLIPFALDTDAPHQRAMRKLAKKNGDLIVVNRPAVIGEDSTSIEILASGDRTVAQWTGSKSEVADHIIQTVIDRFYSE